MKTRHAVTGAAGYTGKYITRRLLNQGIEVIGLTNHPLRKGEFEGRIPFYSYDFDQPGELERHLEGVEVLYNTYWVRFVRGQMTFASAVRNTQALIQAAGRAGVRRLVHVSITNPSLDSTLPYFRGKALLEKEIRESGLSYAILRPTVLFGLEDILINNIAFLLRKFPIFAIPGAGDYRLQPVYVDDLAALALQAGFGRDDCTLDAVGPEVFTYNTLVDIIAQHIGRNPPVLHLPPAVALGMAGLLGSFLGDVVITPDEVRGLSANLLVSDQPPTCSTRLSDWLEENGPSLGQRYASEIERHYQL